MRNAASTSASSAAAMMTASVRLSIAVSMKSAGRKTRRCRSARRPGRAPSRRSASSTPRVTSSVFGARELLDDELSARRSLAVRPRRRSAAGGPRRRSRRRRGAAWRRRALDRHLGQLARASRSAGCAGPASAGSGVSMKPPVPGRRRLEEAERRHELRVAGGPDRPEERDVACPAGARGRPAPAAAGRAGPRSPRWRRRRRPSGAAGSSSARAPTARSATASADESADHHHPARRRDRLEHLRRLPTFGNACACVSRSCDELAGVGDVRARARTAA